MVVIFKRMQDAGLGEPAFGIEFGLASHGIIPIRSMPFMLIIVKRREYSDVASEMSAQSWIHVLANVVAFIFGEITR